MESVECLVVGAGVIGLAVARALARAGREVIVVESESGIGAGASSRNSEVIHAGIYYPPGLDKTRLCVDGKAMLYAFCREFGVPHKRCGKLLVAANAGEVDKLAALKAQAETNGVTDLIWLRARKRARSSPRWSPIVRCCRPRPASSTAMPSCWLCAATPKPMAR
jgi:L-2-hydroxyglutarate oxidase LhgO